MSLNKNEANKRLIEKINQVEKDYNRNFSNTQKILLTTDGSITAILDVLFGKIGLTTIEQHTETASAEQAELIDSKEGAEINFREIVMHKDDEPLIYALSYVPLDRLTDEIKCDLMSANIPIGRILKTYKIESRREINNIFIEKGNETLEKLYGTSEEFLSRDYVIIHKGEILMWIKESFPISYFTEI